MNAIRKRTWTRIILSKRPHAISVFILFLRYDSFSRLASATTSLCEPVIKWRKCVIISFERTPPFVTDTMLITNNNFTLYYTFLSTSWIILQTLLFPLFFTVSKHDILINTDFTQMHDIFGSNSVHVFSLIISSKLWCVLTVSYCKSVWSRND